MKNHTITTQENNAYNGWTNYETWSLFHCCINQEDFYKDCTDFLQKTYEIFKNKQTTVFHVSETLKFLFHLKSEELLKDKNIQRLKYVNWIEITEYLFDDLVIKDNDGTFENKMD